MGLGKSERNRPHLGYRYRIKDLKPNFLRLRWFVHHLQSPNWGRPRAFHCPKVCSAPIVKTLFYVFNLNC